MRNYNGISRSFQFLKKSIIVAVCVVCILQSMLGVASSSETTSLPLLIVIAENSEGGEKYFHKFDRKTLEAFSQRTITTETPWTTGVTTFTGPLLRDVIQEIKIQGENLKCTALNDYSITIPVQDSKIYDVIIAMKRNGEIMSVREKGPLWIIYPWSENSSLWNETYFSRSIWQLRDIEILK